MSPAGKAVWHKSWTETRLFFRIGLAFLLASALALYVGYPDDYTKRFPNGALAVGAEQVRTLLHDGRAYIWLSWFGTSLLLGLSFLALALASTGIVRSPEGGAAPGVTYALSMPVSRRKLASVRIAVGILELAAAAIVSTLLVCALAPIQGQSFPVGQGVAHALLATAGALGLYGVFVFLSATLGELPKAVAGGTLLFLYGAFTFLTDGVRRFSVFRLMTGDTYFESGVIPWLGIGTSIALATTLVYASIRIVEGRDC
jgi:hypothetical protein